MALRSEVSRAPTPACGVGGASRASGTRPSARASQPEPGASGRAGPIWVFGTCARCRTRNLLVDEAGLICRPCVEAIRMS